MARMESTAPQDDSGSEATREPAETRSAILAAARNIALRDGVPEMSLTSVACEAGCAIDTVDALFSSKDDVLLAVIADDLAVIARAMRGSLSLSHRGDDSESDTQSPEELEHTSNAAPDREPLIGSRFPVVLSRRDQNRALEVAQAIPAAQKELDEAKEAIAKLQDSVSRLESRHVDSWLERRLREFERALDVLQDHRTKQNNTESRFEEHVRDLQQSLEDLERRQMAAAEEAAHGVMLRLEASEKHLLQLVSKVEADTSGHVQRLTAPENAAPTPLAPESPEAPPFPEPEIAKPEESKVPQVAQSSLLSNSASYLATARRSAQAAAVAQQTQTPRKARKKTNPTLLYLACGSLVLFIILLVGMGLLLRNSEMDKPAQRLAVQPQQTIVPHRRIAKAVPHAPRDDRQIRLRKLAEAGNPAAELLVGLEYLDGNVLPKNESAAFAWLSRAASKGQPIAQYSLGTLWSDGAHADPVQAFQWFGASALRGNRRAMHSLAVAYAQGLGTTKNLTEAARWFERAATLGAVNSQFDLALLYERGMGVPQNLSTAYKWYAIAAAQGDRESQARVAALGSTLLPADLEAAKAGALSFHPEQMDASANVPPKLSDLP